MPQPDEAGWHALHPSAYTPAGGRSAILEAVMTELLQRYPPLADASLALSGLALYVFTRGAADQTEAAQRNAARLVRLEERCGLHWEPRLNAWAARSPFWTRFWNVLYFWAHAPVIGAVLLWLYRRNRPAYGFIRDAFLGSAAVALTGYRAFPVAPPRLIDGRGFVDTMAQHSRFSYQAKTLSPLVNPYAAVPSMHFAWAALVGVALVMAHPKSRLAWTTAVAHPILMFLAIVATANHWVLDAVAGLGACLAGLGLATARRCGPRGGR
jgi:hypothetical protein